MLKAWVLFISLALISFASAAAEGMRVKVEKAGIYSSSDGGTEKGTLVKGDVVNLVKKGPMRTMVKTNAGLKGWIDNSAVEFFKVSRGDVYNIDEQEITGWLDNPSAIYILDNSGAADEALPLSRSFRDEVFELKDREEIERSNDENN